MAGLAKYFIESENIGLYEQIFENVNIIDCHAHIGRDIDGHHMSAGELVKELDRNDIDKAIIFPLNDPHAGSNFSQPNDDIYRAFKFRSTRFIPFFRLNPNNDWKAEFNKRVNQGFKGVKLHPLSQQFSITSPSAMKLYEKIEKENLILMIHSGFGLDRVADQLNTVTKRFPKLKLIIGHGGFVDIENIIKLLKDRNNVLFDTSTMRIFDLITLLKSVSYKKILFGSDIPYYNQTLALQMLIDSANIARETPNQIQSMLGENLQKWLK